MSLNSAGSAALHMLRVWERAFGHDGVLDGHPDLEPEVGGRLGGWRG